MKSLHTSLVLMIVTLLTLAMFTHAAWARPPEVEIEVTPASVEIPTEGTVVEVLVVVRNPGADELGEC